MNESQKENKRPILEIDINIEAIKSAARNASSIDKVSFEVKTIDPLQLKMEETIWSLVLNTVKDKADKHSEHTAKYIAIRKTKINSLNNTVKEGFITVNGDIDIPKNPGSIVALEDVYMSSEPAARSVARILTEEELYRVDKLIKEKEEEKAFLQKQITKDRF